MVQPREPGIEYSVTHHAERFFITTNDAAPNFRLVQAPVSNPSKENWTPVLPYRPAVQAGWDRRVPEPPGRSTSGRRVCARFACSSWLPARSTWFPSPSRCTPSGPTRIRSSRPRSCASPTPRWSPPARWSSTTWPRGCGRCASGPRCSAATIQTLYRSERIFATAPDGEQVPISLVYRLPFERDATRPLLLNGYGAYGLSYDPAFSSNSLSLLDRGFVVAIAHVRGGEDMGTSLVRGRQAAEQAQHLHRFHRLRRAPDRGRATPQPTGWRSTAAAPAGCSWAR